MSIFDVVLIALITATCVVSGFGLTLVFLGFIAVALGYRWAVAGYEPAYIPGFALIIVLTIVLCAQWQILRRLRLIFRNGT